MILPPQMIAATGGIRRPLRNTYVQLGDSKLAYSFSGGGNNVLAKNFGITHWGQRYTHSRWRSPKEANFGVAGDTTSQVLQRIDAALAYPADVFVVLAGSNDRRNGTKLEDSKMQLARIIRQLRNANKLVIVVAETPKSLSGSFGQTMAQALDNYAYRMWIKQTVALWEGVIVVDPWAEMVDPTSQYYEPLPGMVSDGAHQTCIGAEIMGRHVAMALNRLSNFPGGLPISNSMYNLDQAITGSLTPNPMMLGTGGTIQSGTNPQAGSVLADNYTFGVEGGPATGISTKLYKEASPRVGELQVIEITGTPTADNLRLHVYNNATFSYLSANDKCRQLAWMESQGPGANQVSATMVMNGSYALADGDINDLTSPYPSKRIVGTLETPSYTHGSATSLTQRVTIGLIKGATVNMKVKIGQMGVSKFV